MVRDASPADAPALAALHALAFDHPWTAEEIADLLDSGAAALMAADGFILIREAAGEAEILTLAVAPAARRQGLGRMLVEAAIERLGAAELFMEVAADNAAAIALYTQAGFVQAGARRGYYARPGGAVDALLLKRGQSSIR
jgi:ribosomal-protein-alanine N-acetyltransferase